MLPHIRAKAVGKGGREAEAHPAEVDVVEVEDASLGRLEALRLK